MRIHLLSSTFLFWRWYPVTLCVKIASLVYLHTCVPEYKKYHKASGYNYLSVSSGKFMHCLSYLFTFPSFSLTAKQNTKSVNPKCRPSYILCWTFQECGLQSMLSLLLGSQWQTIGEPWRRRLPCCHRHIKNQISYLWHTALNRPWTLQPKHRPANCDQINCQKA